MTGLKAKECSQKKGHHLETIIFPDKGLETTSQLHIFSDVMPQTLQTEAPQNKPQLQGAETSSQGDLPILVVRHQPGEVMSQVRRCGGEGIDQQAPVPYPGEWGAGHRGTYR